MNFEEKCKCGTPIPRGYGYYNGMSPVRCFNCRRINQRNRAETPQEFLNLVKKAKSHSIIIYDEAGFIPFNTSKRNFVSPNKVQIPVELIIELGFLRRKNLCAKCGKKMDIPDYHIQLCRACRLIEFEKYSQKIISNCCLNCGVPEDKHYPTFNEEYELSCRKFRGRTQ